MESHVKRLGNTYIVFGVGGAALVLGLYAFVALVAISAGIDARDPEAAFRGAFDAAYILLMLPGFLPAMIAGFGLAKLRPWARIMGIIVAVLYLPGVPIGTVLGVYGLWVLLNSQTKLLFHHPPKSDAGSEENRYPIGSQVLYNNNVPGRVLRHEGDWIAVEWWNGEQGWFHYQDENYAVGPSHPQSSTAQAGDTADGDKLNQHPTPATTDHTGTVGRTLWTIRDPVQTLLLGLIAVLLLLNIAVTIRRAEDYSCRMLYSVGSNMVMTPCPPHIEQNFERILDRQRQNWEGMRDKPTAGSDTDKSDPLGYFED